MLIRVNIVQVCDARDDDSPKDPLDSNGAGKKILTNAVELFK